MPDQYTETTKTGWGTRLGRSFKGIFIGILLFIGSFVLLYWNEGRVDLSTIAEDAVNISSTEKTEAPLEGALISTTGKLTTSETLGDGKYLKPGKYVAVERNVEMYAWVEETSTESDINYGGSETTETTYSYSKQWTSNPADSSSFKISEDHENPKLEIESEKYIVNSAKVGIYDIKPKEIALIPAEKLSLSDNLVNLAGELRTNIEGNYIYKKVSYGSNEPQVGDVRISYKVVRPDVEVTAFGKLSGTSILPYVDTKEDATIYRLFTGTPEQAVSQMHGEYKTSLWILRIVGLVLMWVGLMMVFEPLSVLLDVLPFMGSVSRGLVKLLTFVVAFVLSVVTIIVSMIFHNIWALILVLVIVAAGVIFLLKTRGKDFLKKKMKE